MNSSSKKPSLPVVRRLPDHLDAWRVFQVLEGLPGRLFLDSATSSQASSLIPDAGVAELSRYSFVCADPIVRLDARTNDPNPWPRLASLVRSLPTTVRQDLPPFQGGIAGVIGYDSVRWLEPLELSDCYKNGADEVSVPTLSLGAYDWVIAFDHHQGQCWLISQGFGESDLECPDSQEDELDFDGRFRRANERADQVMARLDEFPVGGVAKRSDERSAIEDGISKAVSSDFSSQEFRDAVALIIEKIRSGAAFQVNLAHRLEIERSESQQEIYGRLRAENPAPFAGFYDGGDFQILSSSPEGFLKVRGSHVQTRPIKGTVPRTGDPDQDRSFAEKLSASDKDRAENIMIVDLMRNDLSRVCCDESVVVSRLCQVERYQFVQHLVSVVEGRLRDDADAVDLMKACFPGGSVTGAPKIEAMRLISSLEKHARTHYCGSLGYFGCGGDADFNILIRTMTAIGKMVQFPVGGGITAKSQPGAEESETWAKAQGMIRAFSRNA